jgi:ASTRA-associated protein 1
MIQISQWILAGIIMSMHLLPARGSNATTVADRALSLIASYENGSVKLWRYREVDRERSIEGVGWQCVWSLKLHVESGAFHTLFSDNALLS